MPYLKTSCVTISTAIFKQFLTTFNDYFYTYILIIILLFFGLYFSFRTRFVQFRLFGEQIKSVTEKPDDKSGVSSFQALMLSTASRVGTGNIIGVNSVVSRWLRFGFLDVGCGYCGQCTCLC